MALLFGLCVVPLAGAVAALVYIEGERSTEFERNRLQALVHQYVEWQDSLVESSSLYSQALVKDLHLARPGADCTAALAAMAQQQPGRFLHLAVRGAAGELWCSAGAPPQPLGEQAQASLTAALSQGRPAVGAIAQGRAAGTVSLALYTPLPARSAHQPGVLIAELDLGWLNQLYRQGKFASRWVTGLMSDTGRVLFRSPDPEHWMGRDASATRLFKDMKAIGFSGQIATVGLDGVSRQFSLLPFGKETGAHVTLWMCGRTDAIMDNASVTPVLAGGVTLLILLTILLILWQQSDVLVLQPAALLVQTARRLGAGDAKARVHLGSSKGELGALAATFDAMAESLERMGHQARANRALRVLLAVRATPNDGDDEELLYTAICRSAVEAGDYHVAWIGLSDPSSAGPARFAGGWGEDLQAIRSQTAKGTPEERLRGQSSTAIREQRVVTNSFGQAATTSRASQVFAEFGLKSSISIPLRDGAVVYGALSILGKESDTFSHAEAILLAESAIDITAMLHALRNRRERRLAQAALAEMAQMLTLAEEVDLSGSWSVDFQTNRVQGSAGFYRILGTTPQEFAGTPQALYAAIHPEDRDLVSRRWQESNTAKMFNDNEYRILRPDGEARHLHVRSLTTTDAAGTPLTALATMRDITSEVKTRNKLADRDAIFRAVVGQARDAVVIIDVGTRRFVEFNKSAHEFFGYDREAFGQLTVDEVGQGVVDSAHLAQLEQMLMQESGGVVETCLRQRNGSFRDLRISAAPIAVHGHTYLAAIMTDLTEVKASERELRRVGREQGMVAAVMRAVLHARTEQDLVQAVCTTVVEVGGYPLAWLGQAQDDPAQTVFVLGSAGKSDYLAGIHITWSGDANSRGPTGRAIIEGRPIAAQRLATEPDYEPWRASALEHGFDSSISLPMHNAEGRVQWCLTAYSPSPQAFGAEEMQLLAGLAESVAHGLRAVRDRSARLEAEDQNRKLLQAVEQSPECIAITDLKGNIEYVNAEFVRHTGYSREELIGRNPRILQSGKTPRATYAELWGQLTQGLPWQGEFVNRRKDGSEYVELASMTPVRQSGDKITHYLAIKADITESKHTAKELEDYRHRLEDLVASRTVELADARQRAEAASLAKSAFLANMSHEIRTPMNAIIGLTHLLKQTEQAPAQADRLGKIERSARHLLGIINDILDLSKVEAGKLRIEEVDFDVGDMLAEVAEMIGDRAREKNLLFTLDVADNVPRWLNGDTLRLSQILLNLGTNAVKFTHHGEVALRVTCPSADGNMARLRCEVTDTGIGLTPEALERLFQPFEQADVSTIRRFGGTGLGLAICRRLVELLGGTLGVTSQPGVGSTFWVELPMARAVSEGRASQRLMRSGVTRAIGARTPPQLVRILVVEDDPINQEVAVDLLGSQGFVVDVAENGQVALRKTSEHDYHAILMDLQMPVMDGLTATRELRKRPATASTPILAMSASAFAEDRDACTAAGFDDFLAKPIDPDSFYSVICMWTGAVVPAAFVLPPPVENASLRASLAEVAGLSTEAGLRVVQGNWSEYEQLLRRFCQERSQMVASLRAELAAQQWTNAQRMAHTLKGLAATLGAIALQRCALAVELSLSRGESDMAVLAPRLEALEHELDSLIAGVAARLPAAALPAPAAPHDADAKQVLEKLRSLVASNDVAALYTYRAHVTLLQHELGSDAPALARHLAAFDFQAAQGLLAGLPTVG